MADTLKRIIFEPLLGPDGKQVVRIPLEGDWIANYRNGFQEAEGCGCIKHPIFTRREEEMAPFPEGIEKHEALYQHLSISDVQGIFRGMFGHILRRMGGEE